MLFPKHWSLQNSLESHLLLDVPYVTSYCSLTSLLRIMSGEHVSAGDHASGHYFIFRFLQHDGYRMT